MWPCFSTVLNFHIGCAMLIVLDMNYKEKSRGSLIHSFFDLISSFLSEIETWECGGK